MPDLMKIAPCGFVSFADDGTMLDVNDDLCDTLGYARIELLGWHIEKILPPGGRIFYHTHVFPLLKVQGRVEEIYIALRTKAGRDVPVLFNGARRERDARFVSDVVCLRMLQRHAYEDQLLQARRLAEEANDAKAKFLSMMSHDLRTPLTTISGHADLLRGGVYGPLTPEQSEAVEHVRRASRVLMRMITDILEFARIDSGHLQVKTTAVPVAEAIERAESLVRVQLDEAGLTFTHDACDAAVAADADKLQQVLLNLLTNAIKFTPSGGTIVVTCDRDGDRVRIQVRDTGVGIAPDDLPRVFSPFVQLEPASTPARGVGLGLAISRDLARAMHGDVTATSEVGRGSVFTIELPGAPV